MRHHTDPLGAVLDQAERDGRFLDGLKAIEASIQSGERSPDELYYEKTIFQLAAGMHGRALETVREQHAFLERPGQRVPLSVRPLLALVLWLTGKRDKAIEALISEIEGLRAGRLIYADASGGADLGVMLLYFSTTHGDPTAEHAAHAWLQDVLKLRRATNWPGPLARHLLGEIGLNDALAQVGDLIGSTLEEVLATAEQPEGRLEAHEVLFYLAVKARLQNDENQATRWFSLLARLPRRISSDLQWLAAAEAERG